MSENTSTVETPVSAETVAPETTETSLQEQLQNALAERDKWKALSRKNEERGGESLKRLQELEAEYAQVKGKLPEFEKVQADLTAQLSEANIATVKEKLGRTYGLSDVFTNALTGSTIEEIEQCAQAFAEEINKKPTTSTRVIDESQGEQTATPDVSWAKALGMI